VALRRVASPPTSLRGRGDSRRSQEGSPNRQVVPSASGAECKSALADGARRPRAISRDDAAAPATPTRGTRRVTDNELICFDGMYDDGTRTDHCPFADLDRRDN